MNIPKLPETLELNQIQALRKAFGHFYDQENSSRFVDKPSGYSFSNVTDFVDYLYSPEIGIPKGTSAKHIGITLESWYETRTKTPETGETTMTPIPKAGAESNTLTPEQLKQFEEESKTREDKIKKTRIEATKQVEDSLKRKREVYQKLQESLKNKKIYAKVEATKSPPVPDENTQKFIEEAKTHPASFEKDLTENIKAKLTQTLSEKVSNEEIDLMAKKTAYDTVNTINNPVVQADINNQTAILNALSKGNSVTSKTIGNTQTETLIKEASSELSFFKNSTGLSRSVLSSVNENLAISVFGVDPNELRVSFFENPVEGHTHQVDFGQLSQGYQNLLGSQSEIFNNFGSLGKDQIQGYLLGQARTFLDSQVAKLPVDHALASLYNSQFGQQLLSFVGLEKFVPFEGNFLGGFIQQIPGASTFFEGLGSTLGIDFGIAGATPVAVAGGTVATTGGVVATEATAGVIAATTTTATGAVIGTAGGVATGVAAGTGSGVAAGASAGLLGGPLAPITVAIGAVLGAVFGKVIQKIDWGKLKKAIPWILGAVVGLPVVVFIGPVAGIVVGVGTFGVLSAAGRSGSLTTAGIGIAIALLLKRLGKGFFSIAVKPILIFLLITPVVVAIILFIINSGAYIVPPTSGVGRYYGEHDCSAGVKIVEKAESFNRNLQKGFNGYYNKSPDYPELWNAVLFAQNPNPLVQTAAIGSDDMFWCNYTPTKSYLAINQTIPFGLTPMMNYFISRGKWTSGSSATTKDICPGDTIFFRTPAGASYLSHVAVVSSVTEDEIITVQSNSPWKHNDYPTDSSGHFPIYGSGSDTIEIVGFGAP